MRRSRAGSPARRSLWVAALVSLIAIAVCAGLLAREVLSSRNLTREFGVPPWLEALSQRDDVAYPAHAAIGTALERLAGPAEAIGVRWLKAAAHARTATEVMEARRGIAAGAGRAADRDAYEAHVCTMAEGGVTLRQAAAVRASGLRCDLDPAITEHVPEGTPIAYEHRPPIGGPHYTPKVPTYGVMEQAVAPGYWVHNLEHGAVVLLYRCEGDCRRPGATPASVPRGPAARPQHVGRNGAPARVAPR